MSEMSPRERFEQRKALLATLTKSTTSGFVYPTTVTRWAQGQEQVIRKGWVSWLTPSDNISANETHDFDRAIPCNHVHTSKNAATKCCTQRHDALSD